MQRVQNAELKREVWQIKLLDGLIVIQLNDDKKSGWTQPPEPFKGSDADLERVIDASYMVLCHACSGVNVEAPEYVIGLQLYIDSEEGPVE